MENLENLPNIRLRPAAAPADKSEKKQKESEEFSKNYLDTKVPAGQGSKKVTFRLLPMNLETGEPWVLVHTHNVQIHKDLAYNPEKPFRDFICLSSKNGMIDHNLYGYKCPFCEKNHELYEQGKNETDKDKQKKLYKESCSYATKESAIMRGIVRGKEDEGVKFLKVRLRDDNTDLFHQIKGLAEQREADGIAKGKPNNILDIYEGRDLIITFTEGNGVPTVVDDSDRSPLSEDKELMKKWIYDEKKWFDVFSIKPYDYLKLVSELKYPFKDKEKDIWVDRDVYNAEHGRSYGKSTYSTTAKEDTPKSTISAPVVPDVHTEEDIPF